MESFLQHINKQVRQGEEQESLVAAARRIGPYEVLEPSSEEVEKNLRPFSTLDLMAPMLGVAPEHTRQLLFEGPARVKEGREGKLDVYLFLFSDVLLVTKPPRKADKAKVIRPPLMLEKLVCRPLRDPSHPAKAEGRGVYPTEEGALGPLSGPRWGVPMHQALHAFPGGLSEQHGGQDLRVLDCHPPPGGDRRHR